MRKPLIAVSGKLTLNSPSTRLKSIPGVTLAQVEKVVHGKRKFSVTGTDSMSAMNEGRVHKERGPGL
jgi:hypothetical protein